MIMDKESIIDTLCEHIWTKNMEMKASNKIKSDLRSQLEEKDREIASLKEQINRQFEHIQTLLEENKKYENIKKTSKEVKKIIEELGGKDD